MAATAFALFDDIATLLDDVSLMSKVAAKQASAMAGDDVALNAQMACGFDSNRELSLVWAVAKGSIVNKAILVPVALTLSAFAPWVLAPMLMLGGSYLCFEGSEKLTHADPNERHFDVETITDLVGFERDRIQGAIKTDFILSAEIIAIVLGSVGSPSPITQAGVLIGVAILMTTLVYGSVAVIVKLDDVGLMLAKRENAWIKLLGVQLVQAAPILMRLLTLLGTGAMFLVGGGIMVHTMPWLHHATDTVAELVAIFIRVSMASTLGPLIAAEVADGLKWILGGLIQTGVGVAWGLILMVPVNAARLLSAWMRGFSKTR